MNPDDARNAARVANAGLVFVTGFGVVAIAGQVFWLLWKAGLLPDAGDWGFRATLAAIGPCRPISAMFPPGCPRRARRKRSRECG